MAGEEGSGVGERAATDGADARPRILVIDDLRDFSADGARLTYARTVDEGLLLLREGGPWDEVWWDHHMGPGEDGRPTTVRPLLDWVEQECAAGRPPALGRCVVHTSDAHAGRSMVDALSRRYPTRRAGGR